MRSRTKKKLPIGIQSFVEIRDGGYYYVDKTRFVLKLVEEGKYYFLSRPRRFGKSLFLDTLKQAFLGRRELFEGLYLEKNWDWDVRYPVVHIDFGGGVTENSLHLKKTFFSILEKIASDHQIHLTEELIERRFMELIEKMSKKYGQKVVVLIDEYDKPILDRMEDREAAMSIREELRNIYSVLKPLDEYLRFVFITG
ncbi:MAG: AAA family ATPase, partial [Candidatus Calescibacterium sp.]|nr:AAA family ATPase [Candidatus Calescibacterium sp.]